tara:strand:- start:6996 stop:7322 length:327 start_codon:yes stop_codon:yes gene_type:complete
MSKWTEEQVEYMEMCAEKGFSLEETSEKMIATGWENRTVPSVRSKYRSHTGQKWPETIFDIIEDDIVEDIPYQSEPFPETEMASKVDWVITTCVLIGAMIIGYWWSIQ